MLPSVAQGRAGCRHAGLLVAACFLLTFITFAAWSLVVPPFGSIDDPAQLVKAAAVVRGQLVGSPIPGGNSADATVQVPAVFVRGTQVPWCFIDNFQTSAACAPAIQASDSLESVTTYVATYPPTYYALTGLPSLVAASVLGMYMMRLLSAALSALFITLAIMAIIWWSRSRLMVLAVLVAVTPMTLYLGGNVNPNGLEITTSVCVWVTGIILVRERLYNPPRGLVVLFGVAAGAMCLIRAISPFWVVLALLVLFCLSPGPLALLRLVRRREVQFSAMFVLLASLFTTLWAIKEHSLSVLGSPVPTTVSTAHILATLFTLTGGYLEQMVGAFDWVDFRGSMGLQAPAVTYITWLAVVSLAVITGLVLSDRKMRIALSATALGIVVVPMILTFLQVHQAGYSWQGRYTLPFAAGLPLLAATAVDPRGLLARRYWRLVTLAAAGLALAQILAFAAVVHRYAVGVSGPLDFFSSGWQPPLTSAGLLVIYAGAMIAVPCLVAVYCRNRPLLPIQQGPVSTGERNGVI